MQGLRWRDNELNSEAVGTGEKYLKTSDNERQIYNKVYYNRERYNRVHKSIIYTANVVITSRSFFCQKKPLSQLTTEVAQHDTPVRNCHVYFSNISEICQESFLLMLLNLLNGNDLSYTVHVCKVFLNPIVKIVDLQGNNYRLINYLRSAPSLSIGLRFFFFY